MEKLTIQRKSTKGQTIYKTLHRSERSSNKNTNKKAEVNTDTTNDASIYHAENQQLEEERPINEALELLENTEYNLTKGLCTNTFV